MSNEYKVIRKLQEQRGSYHVVLPKMWVEAQGLKESDPLVVSFNGDIHIKPALKTNRSGAAK